MKVVIDSYAWIELILGSEKGRKVKQILETAESVYTPDTVLAELARKYTRENVPEKTVRERLEMLHNVSHILHITPEIALLAAQAYADLSIKAKQEHLNLPSLFDGIVLGATRAKEAVVVTGDPHFRNLEETMWI